MANTDTRPKLQSVETARALAAILVVLYHAARHIASNVGYLPFGSFSKFGHAGVDFFFVLSGFIILFIHYGDIGRPARVGHYAQRRVTRIYPLYWVASTIGLFFLYLSPDKPFPDTFALVRDYLLLPLGDPTLGVAWSLQLEIIFYILFGVLIFNRALGMIVFAGWAAYTLLSVSGALETNPNYVAFNLQFAFGLMAAWLLLKFRLPAPRVLLCGGLAAFLIFGWLENVDVVDGYALPARVAYGLSAMITLLGLVESERSGLLSVPAPLAALGRSSYAIYLFHILIIAALWQALLFTGWSTRLAPELIYLGLVAASVIGGMIVERVVERPLLALVRRRSARPQPDTRPGLAADTV